MEDQAQTLAALWDLQEQLEVVARQLSDMRRTLEVTLQDMPKPDPVLRQALLRRQLSGLSGEQNHLGL